MEYSSREVSPSQLLTKQLIRANSIFLLHHAASLQDLYARVGRTNFCSLLERYWNQFTRGWDVLLHGNPAVEICNGVKLASGGELGVGVGEEDWGSGEREVLEDFVRRTEGCVDLIVGRFGDEPLNDGMNKEDPKNAKDESMSKVEPWLGVDLDPRPSDGVIFSGVGAISRRSLTTVSQWIEAIFRHGEHAYGVGENPSSRPRQKKRRVARSRSQGGHTKKEQAIHPQVKSPAARSSDLRRKAMENNAVPTGIPPPLVVSVERSLDKAASNVQHAQKKDKFSSQETSEDVASNGSSTFGSEQIMKYLTLGYGSAWTLSPKGFTQNPDTQDSTGSSKPDITKTPTSQAEVEKGTTIGEGEADPTNLSTPPLEQLDPTPEVSDEETPFIQRLEQSIGKFIIGLSGDLENTEFDAEDEGGEAERKSTDIGKTARRIFLRTLTVELAIPYSFNGHFRPGSLGSARSGANEPPTSASATVDGSRPIMAHQKLQVVVYVHQPFIFLFLFELHTQSLTMPSFYRNLHHHLGPLQRPLLSSTDPANVADRMAGIMGDGSTVANPAGSPANGGTTSAQQTIYDIVFDPLRLTVRASLPNIPIPGSLAAEGLTARPATVTVSGSWYTLGIPVSTGRGIGSSPTSSTSSLVQSDWTRVEALSVHTQILNGPFTTSLSSSKSNGDEFERTVRSTRGWWVVWMKVRDEKGGGETKEAVLVRKASDQTRGPAGKGTRSSASNAAGKWLLREQPGRDVSGGSSRSAGSTAAPSTAGVGEGVGVDARKWVEGLLQFV